MKISDREKAFELVSQRTFSEIKDSLKGNLDLSVENVINDTLFYEKQRLKSEKPSKAVIKEKIYWKRIGSTFYRSSSENQEGILREIIDRYTREIMGGFDPKLFDSIAKLIPLGIASVFGRFSPIKYIRNSSDDALEKNLKITGPTDQIRKLSGISTLIFVPNHQSNFDSIAIGYSLHQKNIPPVVYGAGINLFSNPAISFLMNNLGAYKVDRKKKNNVYKTTLKTYATVSLEMGYHNLFFPGGTRSRSGSIEKKLKLGLVGSGIKAYINNLKEGVKEPNIFVIPVSVNYGLGLEAETLINDFLVETGKSRYIIVNDESSKPLKLLRFFKKLTTLNSKIHINFGNPLDLFGNKVNEEGKSLDKYDRIIDIRKYVQVGDGPDFNTQRDNQYTRHLGSKILQQFSRLNVVMSTHITAYCMFKTVKARYASHDLYRILRLDTAEVNTTDVTYEIGELVDRLKTLHRKGQLCLDSFLTSLSPHDILENATQQFTSYHGKKTIWEKNQLLCSNNLKILYYYNNKLDGYKI